MDMLFLRLDAIIALTVNEYGDPVQWQSASLLPDSRSGNTCQVDSPRPWNQTEAGFLTAVSAIEEELARNDDSTVASGVVPRALLVSVGQASRVVQENNLAELTELARTAGLEVVGKMTQRVNQINPRHIMGRGKLAELEVLALRKNAGMLVFDGELSPTQLHNLADITERKVIDRTQLILDIFAQHAVSLAGKLQVELAQLRYLQPRLSGKNRAMDRLMGGIGGRGPGETKLETDRRKNRERMARIQKDLEQLKRQRAFTRARRARQSIPVAALVGYTNAGKSSLLNILTKSEVISADRLFATLDPTTRRLRFPAQREIVLADTVGFIRNLPVELKEAFMATLEELEAADLLLHVADASHPDFEQQMAAVDRILEELSFHQIPQILILNKCDLLTDGERSNMRLAWPNALQVSANTGWGLDTLMHSLEDRLLPVKRDLVLQ